MKMTLYSAALAALVLTAQAPADAQPVDPYAPTAEPATPAAPDKPAKPKGKQAKGKQAKAPVEPAPVDPYAEPTPAKPAGKGKKPGKKEAKPAAAAAPAPVDPYAEAPAAGPVAAPAVAPAAEKKPAAPAAPAPAAPAPAPAATAESTSQTHIDLAAVQGLLAVQRLDGWLLVDRDGSNPIARQLVAPEGAPARTWFYLVPATGEPVLLVHRAELGSFPRVPGRTIAYTGWRDLEKSLKAILKGKKTIAMEYSPKGALPSLSRVDAGTLELVRAQGVTIRSSDGLVQFTKALWGPDGRKAHYVAAHHVTELRKEALGFIAKQLAAGAKVTEYDVQERIVRGLAMRGLIGPPPVVATGANTADPYYVPSAERSALIDRGQVVVIAIAGRVQRGRGVFATTTWVAYAGDVVPDRVAKAFDVVALARDEALALIGDRAKRRRAVRGVDVDAAARGFITKAGFGEHFVHRTGHSIDTDLQGAAADLDDYEVKDVRNLVQGTGYAIGPGVYFEGDFGVRAEVCLFLGIGGVEVTTPAQDQVEALLSAK